MIFNGPADLKAGGLGAMLAGVPQRVYRRGLALPVRANPLNRFLFRRVVTHVVANSIATRLALFGELGDIVPDERVAVIPNGIDLARFDRRSEASTFRLDGDVVTVGTVGRLTVQKNHDALLDIARTMLDRDLDVRVCIGGDGELADALRAKSDRIGLGERVSFVGFVDDVPGFMKAIDIFVLTSTWEGFGYVIIEAGAAGRPTVAFDLSSNPEVVVDGETGFLVAPGDHDAFVVCLKRLAEDDLLRDEMGSAARRHVEASFTHGHVMDQLETFLLGETTQG